MRSIRVLIAGMPRMLVDLVKEIVASQDHMEFVGEVSERRGLARAAATAKADILVIGESAVDRRKEYEEILYSQPRLRIVAIAADGRRGFLHQLLPQVIVLDDLSPTSLVEAIRGGSPPHPGGAAS